MSKPGMFESDQARACLGAGDHAEASVWAFLAVYEALTEGVTLAVSELRLQKRDRV